MNSRCLHATILDIIKISKQHKLKLLEINHSNADLLLLLGLIPNNHSPYFTKIGHINKISNSVITISHVKQHVTTTFTTVYCYHLHLRQTLCNIQYKNCNRVEYTALIV